MSLIGKKVKYETKVSTTESFFPVDKKGTGTILERLPRSSGSFWDASVPERVVIQDEEENKLYVVDISHCTILEKK